MSAHLRNWSRETGLAVSPLPRQLAHSPHLLIVRLDRVLNSWAPLLPPAFRDIDYDDEGVHLERQATQLRTDGVHRRRVSVGTEPVVLEVARITGTGCSGNPICQSLFTSPFAPLPFPAHCWYSKRACAVTRQHVSQRHKKREKHEKQYRPGRCTPPHVRASYFLKNLQVLSQSLKV